MQRARRWILGALAVAGLLAAGAVLDRAATTRVEAQIVGDHWRNYNGHWSVWHEADHRWYTTDGRHWFFHDGHGWNLYRFDRSWGRNGFHHGDYVPPPHDVKLVLPPLHTRIVIR